MKKESKVIASWSGGKDSCLAYYKAVTSGYSVSCLLNTISQNYKRVRFHGVKDALIQAQSRAIGIPLLQKETTAEGYEQEFKDAVRGKMSQGIEGVVFGDIYPHMREWADKVCADLGIRAIEPLCGLKSDDIFLDFIESGFEAIVVATQADLLGEEWIGRKLDREFLEDIRRYKNIDVCGENGEYHTLVTAGPVFKQRINIKEYRKVLRQNYWFLDIQNYQLLRTRLIPQPVPKTFNP